MKRKRYTEEQIAFCLRQQEAGTPVEEIIRKMGISEQTFIGGRGSMPVWAWPRFAG
jgi:hypothetical protein